MKLDSSIVNGGSFVEHVDLYSSIQPSFFSLYSTVLYWTMRVYEMFGPVAVCEVDLQFWKTSSTSVRQSSIKAVK